MRRYLLDFCESLRTKASVTCRVQAKITQKKSTLTYTQVSTKRKISDRLLAHEIYQGAQWPKMEKTSILQGMFVRETSPKRKSK